MRSSSTEAPDPRQGTRVEPDPAFVVDGAVATRSRWHGRIAYLAATNDGERAAIHERLRTTTEGVVVAPPTRLFHGGIDKIWRDFQSATTLGPPRMTDRQTFLALLRELCDDIFDAVAEDARLVVDELVDPDAALPVIASVYPDARILRTAGDVDRAVAEGPPAAARVARPDGATSPLQDRLIVVVGCGRSGTTWLESLLMTHPRCGGIEETESFVFHQLEPMWVNLRSERGLHAHLDAGTLARALRRFCDGLFVSALQERPGADHFVEKTPLHVYNLDSMRATYPDAWYVHLVRDGRDVARSMSQVPFFRLPRVEDAAAVWRRVVETVDAQSGAFARFREIKYEHLYEDPVGVATELLAWLGLTVDEPVRAALAGAATRRVSVHARASHPLGRLPSHGLTRRQLAVVHAVAGPALRRRGYTGAADALLRLHPAYVKAKVVRMARRATGSRRG